MNEQWMDDAASRIFSYATDWNEGRKKWSDQDIVNIIKHEMAQCAAAETTARPAQAGTNEKE